MQKTPTTTSHVSGTHNTSKLVLMVVFDGAIATDIAGPLDIFASASLMKNEQPPTYQVEIVSLRGGLVTTWPTNIQMMSKAFSEFENRAIDTLLIAGGAHKSSVIGNQPLIDSIRKAAQRARRVASICTGTFALAQAGLLDERSATTHWNWAEQLQERYPKIKVQPDAIYKKDGKLYSSAGMTAGIDLALALTEEDLGRETALKVAQYSVMFLKRPGGQSQFSSVLSYQKSDDARMIALQEWILANLQQNLSVDRMAEFLNMAPRTFARFFKQHVGTSPAKYVEEMRLNTARQYIENPQTSINEVVRRCGFENGEKMRRSFIRNLGISPQDYRNRFCSSQL
ncbi:GlxA family transcriptional regulator [Pseudovibrio sp. JE062]|uniref:GlxA family transcriptional regulator n=1 Tax=Pseudovibrio sp. JE062 TaxID=439495 RepID=UPI000681DEF0|nr:GlxA family transcriptional regulator [Pseudovibrio sp. JE062]